MLPTRRDFLFTAQVLLNPPREESVFRADVDVVNVVCSVRDKRGAYIKDLAKTDFEVLEDGRRQEVQHFARQVDTPLSFCLLLDISGSMQFVLEEARSTAGLFFKEVLRPKDRAMLGVFGNRIAIWQDWTSSVPVLQTALERLTDPDTEWRSAPGRGGTLLFDAVNLIATEKLARTEGRKAIAIISDGVDEGSLVKASDARKACQQVDSIVYGIHFNTIERSGYDSLAAMAEPTGGTVFRGKDRLGPIFDTIREEMRSQYSLGYKLPAGKPGSYRKLQVKLSRPGLKVNARTGYFAPAS